MKWGGTDFKWGPGTIGPPTGDGPVQKGPSALLQKTFNPI